MGFSFSSEVGNAYAAKGTAKAPVGPKGVESLLDLRFFMVFHLPKSYALDR